MRSAKDDVVGAPLRSPSLCSSVTAALRSRRDRDRRCARGCPARGRRQALRRIGSGRRHLRGRTAGIVLRTARTVRLRQDDDAPDDRRLRGADEGRILLGDQDVVGLPPYKRDVNTVFQSYALFPHMSIEDNVALRARAEGRRQGGAEGPRRGDARARRPLGLRRSESRSSSRAASSSGSRSGERSSTIRVCSCSTSRSARST